MSHAIIFVHKALRYFSLMMFIKLYESALFFKYYNVKIHINTKYFVEALERTGQAEDYRLKLSHNKSPNTEKLS